MVSIITQSNKTDYPALTHDNKQDNTAAKILHLHYHQRALGDSLRREFKGNPIDDRQQTKDEGERYYETMV